MSRLHRKHQSSKRFVFNEEEPEQEMQYQYTQPQIYAPTQKQSHHIHYTDDTYNSYDTYNTYNTHNTQQDPVINNQSDSIYLNSSNYNPNQSLIELTGFNDLKPFVKAPKKSSKSIDSIRDNTFNDYNENGSNSINDSNYRQKLIKQMTDSVMQQTESMFGHSEKLTKSQTTRENPNMPEYTLDPSFHHSTAQPLYLQEQSKRIFRNNN